MILAPCALLREAGEIRAGQMMMMANLCPAHAAEKRLGVVRVDIAVEAIGFLVINPVHCEPTVQLVPRAGFVRIDRGASGDPGADEIEGRDL